MKSRLVNDIVGICSKHNCFVLLDGTSTGAVATITKQEGGLKKQISVYLDRNDKNSDAVLQAALKKIQ